MKTKLPLSYIEISRTNLIHNIKQFRNITKKGTQIVVVIKGNAYGHGQNEVAKILEPYADYFFVNSVEELQSLREISKKKVLLLGYVQEGDLPKAIRLKCILTVFSIKQLLIINKTAKELKIRQEIHIPVDAHLGREGFLTKELPDLFREIQKCKNVEFCGIYAHFANIEDTRDFSHANKQIEEYQEALKIVDKFGFKDLQTHISSTSGILVHEKNAGIHPLVRLGISAYGMWPSPHLESLYKGKIKLKPVLSWRTKVAEVKILPKGHTVGYGLTFKTKKLTRIALIPQGYSDGLDRRLSNLGYVLIHGTKCKIIGRISMNMFVVDVSHLRSLEIEDKVVIIGEQGKQRISAEDIAKMLGTINYEVTARISPLLPRIVR